MSPTRFLCAKVLLLITTTHDTTQTYNQHENATHNQSIMYRNQSILFLAPYANITTTLLKSTIMQATTFATRSSQNHTVAT
jgi:hypothetical protein